MNNIDFKVGEDFINYSCTQKFITTIASELDKETIKAIRKWCEENGYIPNIIEQEKLELVLRLGIDALRKRDMQEYYKNKGDSNE